MTTRSTASRTTRGAVARSGSNGKVKTITFKGVELVLPSKVPFRVLQFLSAGENADATDVVGLLTVILGPEQMERVWNIDVDVSAGMEPLGKLLDDLTVKVLDPYGLTPGE